MKTIDIDGKTVLVDLVTSCDGCGCSYLRARTPEQVASHPAPFWCSHPVLDDSRKVKRADRPFNSRPDWCPLDDSPVLLRAAPRDSK